MFDGLFFIEMVFIDGYSIEIAREKEIESHSSFNDDDNDERIENF